MEDDDYNEWVHASPYGHLHLRDLFAAFALAGILHKGSPYEQGLRWCASTAYDMADAMLAQRAALAEKEG